MYSNVRIQGMTVLEMLLIFGFVVLLGAIVAPVISLNTAETDMKAAMSNLESTVEMARRTAQVYRTSVVLHLQTDGSELDSLHLTLPSVSQSALNESWDFLGAETLEYQFPTSVHLMFDQNSIRFDESGQVADPVHLVLVSHKDSDLVEHILVE